MRHSRYHSAFTLLEVAVVLLIIGLIAGGILFGSDLVRTAQLRQVITQTQGLQTAILTFRQKYGAWPGDIADATAYWSDVANGDGDGILPTDFDGGGEPLAAWQHLANAGFIAGSYTGVPALPPAHPMHEPGMNVPAGTIHTSGYVIWDNQGSFPPVASDDRAASKFLILGTRQNPADSVWSFLSAVMAPIDAYYIDSKLDDSSAATGRVLGLTGTRADVVPHPDDACSSYVLLPTEDPYNLASDLPACLMLFELE